MTLDLFRSSDTRHYVNLMFRTIYFFSVTLLCYGCNRSSLLLLQIERIQSITPKWQVAWHQSHYIEVAQGEIFMEQKMRFGLVLGQLAILKNKLGADSEQLLGVCFSCF